MSITLVIELASPIPFIKKNEDNHFLISSDIYELFPANNMLSTYKKSYKKFLISIDIHARSYSIMSKPTKTMIDETLSSNAYKIV